MKRRIISLPVLCLVVALILATLTFALANAETPKLVVSADTAASGDEVTLTVSAENNPGVSAMTLGLVYDSSKLEYMGFEDGDDGFAGWDVASSAVWTSETDCDSDGVILKLRFKVPDAAEDGSVSVSLTCVEGDALNVNGDAVSFEVVSGGVEIHTHRYTAVVTAPTCTEKGYTTYTCVCGDVKVEDYVDALDHDFGEWQVTTPATCTENGVETRYCSRCDATETREIKAGGHHYTAVVTEPTCTEKGYTTYTCECGDVKVDDYVDALDHDFGEWQVTTPAACTEDGVETRYCSRCDATETREIKAEGHHYTSVVTEPTCTEKGYTTYTCECGDVKVEDYVDALDHDFGEWQVTTPATCTEDGVETRYCSRCDEFETREIKAEGHHYNAVVTEPTCTEKGYTTYTCECGDVKVEDYVDALDHNFGEWQVTTPATCTVDGVETRYCSRCDELETREIKAEGHHYNAVVTKPTCTEKGFTTYTCECGDVKVEDYVDALDHDFGEWTVTTPATCTVDGVETRYCSRCDATETREIKAEGHHYTTVVTEPTCTEKGYTTYTCECGDVKVDDYVDALDHDFGEWQVTTPATCTVDGVETRYCSRCDEYETRAIEATGHHYTAVVTEPTCTEKGYTTYTCECGDVKVDDYVDALDHDFGEWQVTTPATCTEDGVETRYCSRCDATETREIKAEGHHYTSVVTEPTCTEKGYTTYTCECGDVKVDDYVDALDHDFGEWQVTTPATCTVNGVETRYCSRCDATETREIKAEGHHYNAVVTEPTCTEKGYTTYTCECGDVKVEDYVDALDHDFGEWQITTPATCTVDGVETRYCSRCDATETRDIKAEGHHYTAVVTEPTCTEKGYTTYTCKCGDSYVADYVDALDHDFGEWTVTTPAACTVDGVETRYCSRCDATETREIKAEGHHYTAVVTEPTCTEKGYTTYTCECGDVKIDDYVDALDHDFGEWQVTTAPTCTDKGVETRYCSRCDATETREIDALGHDLEHHDGKSATCTEKGWEAYDTCSRCDYTTYNEIPALDHDFGEWQVTTPATCTVDGVETRYCSRCDVIETREIKAEGHHYTAVVTEPTCTEKGYTTYTCECGDVKVEDYVDALDHDFGEWQVTTPATCTVDGVETRYCSRCDEFETREIKAEGHHYTAVVTAPTCTEKGYTTYTCGCGDVKVDDYVDALDHKISYRAVVTPTTDEVGILLASCDRCSYAFAIVMPKLNTTDYTYAVTAESTCTKAGTATYTWKDTQYGEFVFTVALPLKEHSYTAVVTAPTCTEKGYTTHTCSVCGDSYKDTYTDALDHDFGAWKVTKVATCTKNGIETRYCSRCDATETREIKATEHAYVDKVTPATCTEKGYTTHTCSVCGDSYKDTYTDALGHDYGEWIVTKEKTCYKDGTETRYCSRCDTTETRVLKSTGHTYIDIVTAPTCTEQGYTTHTCTAFDHSYVDSFTDPVGHDFGGWKVTTPATCTENGVETRYCLRCDTTQTRVLRTSGHKYGGDGICTVCGEKDPNYKAVNPFVDVKEGSVYYDAILWAYYHTPQQITGGFDATHFTPNNPCTRAQVVTFLWRAAGRPDPVGGCPFVDVSPTSVYYTAIVWAAEQGITTGTDATHFSPNDTVTRAQFVTFLYRYENEPDSAGDISIFKDADQIAGPFQKAVAWAVENGIAGGYGDGTFRPKDVCARWAVLLFMYRDMA